MVFEGVVRRSLGVWLGELWGRGQVISRCIKSIKSKFKKKDRTELMDREKIKDRRGCL